MARKLPLLTKAQTIKAYTGPRLRVAVDGGRPIVQAVWGDGSRTYSCGYEYARTVWSLYKRARAHGQWCPHKRAETNRIAVRTGVFRRRYMRVMKTVVYIGCQRFTHKDFVDFAKLQGWK